MSAGVECRDICCSRKGSVQDWVNSGSRAYRAPSSRRYHAPSSRRYHAPSSRRYRAPSKFFNNYATRLFMTPKDISRGSFSNKLKAGAITSLVGLVALAGLACLGFILAIMVI